MSKEYENKAVTAEMVYVDFDTQVEKRAGGTYDGTNIVYKAFGKINEKGLTTKTFEFKENLRAELEAVNKKGCKFTFNFYREVGGQFWNIDSVVAGHVAQQPRGGATAQASNSFDPNPAAVGQAINLAVELGLAFKYEDFTPNVIRTAIDKYKTLKEEFTSNWEAASKEPSPPPAKKVSSDFADSIEDEVPF